MADDKIIPTTVETALGAPAGGELLTRPQAAELAGVSESTWRRHVEYKLIEPIRDARGRYYFTREAVLAVREQIATHLRKQRRNDDAQTMPTVDRETYVRVLAALDAGKQAPDIALELGLYIRIRPANRTLLVIPIAA